MVFTWDNQWLIVGDNKATLYFFNARTFQLKGENPIQLREKKLIFQFDNSVKYLAVDGSLKKKFSDLLVALCDGNVHFWKISDRAYQGKLPKNSRYHTTCISLTACGKKIVIANSSNDIELWSIENLKSGKKPFIIKKYLNTEWPQTTPAPQEIISLHYSLDNEKLLLLYKSNTGSTVIMFNKFNKEKSNPVIIKSLKKEKNPTIKINFFAYYPEKNELSLVDNQKIEWFSINEEKAEKRLTQKFDNNKSIFCQPAISNTLIASDKNEIKRFSSNKVQNFKFNNQNNLSTLSLSRDDSNIVLGFNNGLIIFFSTKLFSLSFNHFKKIEDVAYLSQQFNKPPKLFLWNNNQPDNLDDLLDSYHSSSLDYQLSWCQLKNKISYRCLFHFPRYYSQEFSLSLMISGLLASEQKTKLKACYHEQTSTEILNLSQLLVKINELLLPIEKMNLTNEKFWDYGLIFVKNTELYNQQRHLTMKSGLILNESMKLTHAMLNFLKQ